jgi:hypothetical protein
VVVVDAGHTRGAEVRAAIAQFDEVGLAKVGCAVVPGWLRGGEPFIPAPVSARAVAGA